MNKMEDSITDMFVTAPEDEDGWTELSWWEKEELRKQQEIDNE